MLLLAMYGTLMATLAIIAPLYVDWQTGDSKSLIGSMINGNNVQGNVINSFLWYISSEESVWSTRDPRVNWWTSKLRENWKVIRDEYAALKEKADLLEWSNMYGRPDWNQVTFYHAGRDNINLEKFFPKTLELVRETPIVHCMISIIGPGKEIGLHYGEYKGILRYHLAIDIPEYTKEDFGSPIVGKGSFAPIHLGVFGKVPFRGGILGSWPFREHRTVFKDVLNGFKIYEDSIDEQMKPARMEWKNGEDLLFDDAFPHYVQNKRNQSRAILFADIPRIDLPWPGEWFVRNLYVHFLPFTTHWKEDMIQQSKGLHMSFHKNLTEYMGEEGFEFHFPEREYLNEFLLFIIPPIMVVSAVVFAILKKNTTESLADYTRYCTEPKCNRLVATAVKNRVYDKQS